MIARPSAEERWRRALVIAWALVGVGLVVMGVFRFLDLIASALTPFLFAVVILFLLRGPVARLQRSGMKRTAAVLVVYAVALLVLVVAGLFIVPPAVQQIVEFTGHLPQYYDSSVKLWSELQDQYDALRLPTWAQQALDQANSTIVKQLGGWSRSIATGVVSAGGWAAGLVVNVVLSVVLGFYLLKDFPTMREELVSLFPARREEAETVLSKVSGVLGGFLRGQLIISTIVGVLIFIGLAVLRVPYAFVIGLLAGAFNIIPYFGPIVGGLLAATSALAFKGWVLALLAVGWVVVVQQIDSMVISPRVMSAQVDLHPVLVIFSLLVGGTLFGFVGLLLAIPIAATAKGLFVYYFEKHSRSQLATEDGALFRRPSEDAAAEKPVTDESHETAEEVEKRPEKENDRT